MSYAERLARFTYRSLLILAFFTLVQFVFSPFDILRDATDPPSGERSGMNLYTDYETGCQYLSRFGAITPRLALGGKQMGCRP